MDKIKVLIVDDSALVRQLLSRILSSDPALEVVSTAIDPFDAREKIKYFNPDVLTLDVEMPKMDGIRFLDNLMRLRPMPVVMVSSLTERSAEVTLQALELGAIDFVCKPKIDISHRLEDYAKEIINKVKAAKKARIRPLVKNTRDSPKALPTHQIPTQKTTPKFFKFTEQIIAIGASTGGTKAINNILTDLPVDSPAIVIAQHIPKSFSMSFAKRLNSLIAMTVYEAEDGQSILPGHVYIAPGDRHLMILRDGARYRCKLSNQSPVNHYRPSIDILFRSIAQSGGPNAIGVILTGMGNDGAEGIKEMHAAGAYTIAQDKKTSTVWGMPQEAIKRGGVDKVLPLSEISRALLLRARTPS